MTLCEPFQDLMFIEDTYIMGDAGYYAYPYGQQAPSPSYDSELEMYPSGEQIDTKSYFTLSGPPRISHNDRPVSDWSPDDVRTWIVETAAGRAHMTELPLFEFAGISGRDLARMSRDDFCSRISSPSNHEHSDLNVLLYEDLQRRNRFEHQPYPEPHPAADYKYELPNYEDLDPEKEQRQRQEQQQTPVKRQPGRPKGSGKKQPKRIKNVSVPDFLRDLLHDKKYCPSIIKWENYADAKFRFVKPDEVAKLWGSKRNNDKMSFEKFSRAMRYHYKQEKLVSVPSVRLVYQFGKGKNAPDYITANPNFEQDRFKG